VILGDERERGVAEAMRYGMKRGCLDLVGKTPLDDCVALVGRMQVMLTNDGGPLHIAVAAGVPTVSVFGPVDEGCTGRIRLPRSTGSCMSISIAGPVTGISASRNATGSARAYKRLRPMRSMRRWSRSSPERRAVYPDGSQ